MGTHGKLNRISLDTSAVALLLMTSGTTSKPKLVPLRQGALTANGSALALSMQLTPQDVCINAMPLFHIGGLSASIFATMMSCGSVIVMDAFEPAGFLDVLVQDSGPSPTWFSMVPTMHIALLRHLQTHVLNTSNFKHSIRLVRSGAAELDPKIAHELRKAWGCVVLPTYSMSEQMPIAQPPHDYQLTRDGTVGMPLVELAIVDDSLCPLFVEDQRRGEICISGRTVMRNYQDNPHANNEAFFILGGNRFFRTGDLGYLDGDGFLYVVGRQKELIKVGGEQVNPYEIEEQLGEHKDVSFALVFGLPDPLYGEVVAAAVVLHSHAFHDASQILAELRQGVQKKFEAYKVPRCFVIKEENIPRTLTGKYRRSDLKDVIFQFPSRDAQLPSCTPTGQPQVGDDGASEALTGIRFMLAILVCFNHIGDHAWPYETVPHTMWSSAVTSFRAMGDTAVILFSILGGFQLTLAVGHSNVGSYKKFYEHRLAPIHPMYIFSCLLCTVNRMCWCQPSDYEAWQYGSLSACKATPLDLSYGGTFALSFVVMMMSLQAWPVGVYVWHINAYSWFSSSYQFCILVYPFIHRILCDKASKGMRVLVITNLCLHGIHYLTLVSMWWPYFGGFRGVDDQGGNYYLFSGYMFPPFWAVRFACGALLGFTFMHFRPAQQAQAWKWGLLTDIIGLATLCCYVTFITFGLEVRNRLSSYHEAESRFYCAQIPRVGTPILCLFLYGIATGRGYIASVCATPLFARTLAPTAYGVYLLHQPVYEWFYAVTHGEWWTVSKNYVFFSQDPVQMGPWETIVVVQLTVMFSFVVTHAINGYVVGPWLNFVRFVSGQQRERIGNSLQLAIAAVEQVAGVQVNPDDNLQATGVASLGTSVLVSIINSLDHTKKIKVSDVQACVTVRDIACVLEASLQVTTCHACSISTPDLTISGTPINCPNKCNQFGSARPTNVRLAAGTLISDLALDVDRTGCADGEVDQSFGQGQASSYLLQL